MKFNKNLQKYVSKTRLKTQCVLESFFSRFGLDFGPLGDPFEASWVPLGVSWAPLGYLLEPLGRLLGRSWDALGALLDTLGRSWPLLAAPGTLLARFRDL